jgi:predicted metalloprotease
MTIIRDQASPPPRSRWVRRRTLAMLALALSLLAVVAAWGWGRMQPAPPAVAVGSERGAAIARQAEVAFADAERLWRRALPDGSGRGYDPARLVFFSRATGTPCAGGALVSGSFYCPETGIAAVDLVQLDLLGRRLGRERELGVALVAARLAAEHLQRELGVLDAAALRLIGARRARRAELAAELALQADCLTGAWAAATGLGAVPDGFYDQLVWSARNLVDDLGRDGVRVAAEFDPFAPGSREARAAAFARGYAAGAVAGCPPPAALAAG